MSFQAGTLTGHGNFLDTLVAFLLSTDCNWQLLNDTDNTACTAADVADLGTSANVTLSRVVYLKSLGLDYSKAIYYCFWEFSNAVTGYYNIGVRCMTSYNSSLKKESQAGVSLPHYICMTNAASTPYWFIANQQRVICLVSSQSGTYRDALYAGFVTPAISASDEVPLPYAVGGSAISSTNKFDDTTGRRAFFNPYVSGPGVATAGQITSNGVCTLCVRAIGAQWLKVGNGASATVHNDDNAPIEPYYSVSQTGGFMPDKVYNSTPIEKVLHPISIWSSITGYAGCFGEFDGVYFVGGEGLGPQDIITIGGTNYLVWNSINQASRNMFAAFKLA